MSLAGELGIEPRSVGSEPIILPLDDSPMAAKLGFEPRFYVSKAFVLPLDDFAMIIKVLGALTEN